MADTLGLTFNESETRFAVAPAGPFIPAFVGRGKRGPTTKSVRVTGWKSFEEQFGGFDTTRDLATFYWEFLRNGGGAAQMLRLVGPGAAGASNTTGLKNKANDTVVANVYAANEGDWGDLLSFTTARYKKTATTVPKPDDATAQVFPNSGDNALSADTGRIGFASILGFKTGDILDIFDAATGAFDASGPIRVVGVDATTSDIFFVNPAGDFLNSPPDSVIVKCATMHRASTVATEALAASALSVELKSVEQIREGSLLTFSIFSHVPSLASRGYCQTSQAVVERVDGRRVYFKAATANAAEIPATTYAFLRYIASGDDGIDFTARAAGPSGISISITVAAAANSVTVVGKHITVNRTAAAKTTANIISAIEADATANGLISCAAVNDSVAGTALAQTSLAGGANLCVVSQEWGLTLKEGGQIVERGEHEFLSLVNTSKDYIGKRLGGTTSPLATARNNRSLRVFLGGDSDVTDTAVNELARFPLAVEDIALAGGEDGNDLTDDDILGLAEPRSGLHILDGNYDIRAISIPGVTSPAVQIGATAWGEAHGGVVVVLDAPEASNSPGLASVDRETNLGIDSSYGQFFFPWGVISDPRPGALQGDQLVVPPAPVVLAAMAVAARTKGQHSSSGNFQVRTWTDLTCVVTDDENNALNKIGVNCIRPLTGRGIRIYGDRTLQQSSGVRQAGNVRRWLNFMKASLRISLSGLPFEIINTKLFGKIEGGVSNFLKKQWEIGALYPDDDMSQAFFIRCNRETTSAADIEQFRVRAQMGVSPAPIVEEIVFEMGITAGGVSFNEAA